jgi:hypothetical protein
MTSTAPIRVNRAPVLTLWAADAAGTALALTPFGSYLLGSYFEEAPDDLKDPLLAMVGVESRTDDILLGHRRELWHPDVRAEQDQKHDEAQAWAEPIVREACERLLGAL